MVIINCQLNRAVILLWNGQMALQPTSYSAIDGKGTTADSGERDGWRHCPLGTQEGGSDE